MRTDTQIYMERTIRSLATNPNHLEGRLVSAFVTFQMMRLEKNDSFKVPEDLADEYHSIIDDMTSEEAVGDEGRVMATLNTKNKETTQELANRMYTLAIQVIMRDN